MTRSSRLLLGITAAIGLMAGYALPACATPPAMAAGDVVLLNFSASWCGPCRQMAPLVGEITAAGWIVRHVDADRERDLVRRFAVTGVPCYVLLVKGQEVGRINGATTRGELEQLLAKSREPLGLAALPASPAAASMGGVPLPVTPAAAALATEPPVPPQATAAAIMTAGPPAAAVSHSDALATPPRQRRPSAVPLPEPVAAVSRPPLDPTQRAALERRLMAATARLLVEDSQGVSRGTGTVIDCRQGEALILTCGHIFRDSQGKGRVEVDLFGADGPRGVAGQVVSWDLKRDLALVSIFIDRQIEPVRVGGADRSTQVGESVVTVGCDGGDDPTIHHSRVTGVDKYLGPANVQVAGQPVQGRSGGGLFAVDGTLIGVCNAADPADNEGLFAALPAIHEQLDEAGLAFVYRSIYPSAGPVDVAAIPTGPVLPSMPAEMPPVSFDRRDRADALPTAATEQVGAMNGAGAINGSSPKQLSPGEQALIDHVWRHDGDAEVICIVRPKGATQSPGDVFVLQGTSREFVEQLAKSPPERVQSSAAQGKHAIPHHAAPPATRSDVATLPGSELPR